MTINELFITANQALLKVVDQIKDDQWEIKAPAEITWQPDQTLRDLVNYHAYDDALVPNILLGEPKAEWEAKYQGDLLDGDPKGNYARFNQTAIDSVKGFTKLDQPAHLSYGDFTAGEYLQHITLYRGLRIYDLAKLIGADATMPPALVQGLFDYIKANQDVLRQMHVIGQQLPVADDAPLQEQLLAMTGRS